ncbi:hypothetical protein CR513_61859, partial [Mucuna pruriens]
MNQTNSKLVEEVTFEIDSYTVTTSPQSVYQKIQCSMLEPSMWRCIIILLAQGDIQMKYIKTKTKLSSWSSHPSLYCCYGASVRRVGRALCRLLSLGLSSYGVLTRSGLGWLCFVASVSLCVCTKRHKRPLQINSLIWLFKVLQFSVSLAILRCVSMSVVEFTLVSSRFQLTFSQEGNVYQTSLASLAQERGCLAPRLKSIDQILLNLNIIDLDRHTIRACRIFLKDFTLRLLNVEQVSSVRSELRHKDRCQVIEGVNGPRRWERELAQFALLLLSAPRAASIAPLHVSLLISRPQRGTPRPLDVAPLLLLVGGSSPC